MERPFGRGTSLLRGLTIAMVINHLRPSWDDPPSKDPSGFHESHCGPMVKNFLLMDSSHFTFHHLGCFFSNTGEKNSGIPHGT